MNRKIIIFLMLALAFVNSSATYAKEIRAKGDVAFESGVFSSEPDMEIKQKAIEIAMVNAWKRYTSEFSTAKLNAYKQSQAYMDANFGEYVIDKTVLDQSLDANSNTYSVVVAVSFNDVAVDSKLNQGNDKSGYVGVTGGKSLLSFLFLAREQDSIKEFDDRKTVKVKEKKELGRKESSGLTSGSSGFHKQSQEADYELVTGGSTLRKADQVNYRVYSSRDVDAAVNDVLSSNNFEVTPFEDITAQCHGPKMEQIKKEFSANDELSPELRLEAIRAAKACDVSIRYFAIGTLDARMSETDPATGNARTSVSVRIQVWDITSGLSKVVASVGPIQKYGLGFDAATATTEALRLAATEGATEVVNQLNSRSVR